VSTPSYLLGHRAAEWDRLEHQHAVWKDSLLDPISALGLSRQAAILELGCGPGALLADLAELTDGPVAAIERDEEAVRAARERLAGRARVDAGDLTTADLGGPWDLVVARWVFSFLPDPVRALERVWAATKPGGWVVLQDYDHDGLGIYPKDPAIDRVIEAYRAAYRSSGGNVWIGAELPQHFARLGARAEVRPFVRSGYVGDPIWVWVERFLFEHLDTVVTGGQLAEAERTAFTSAWERLRATPGALVFSPIQVTLSARR
jgi:SAM-dependent methyltransferase